MNSFWGGVLATLSALCCLLGLMAILWPIVTLWFGFGNSPVQVYRNWHTEREHHRGRGQ